MRTLRDDQHEALEALRDAVASGHRRVMMQASTGFGKTVLAAAIVENARKKGKKVLFTVPAISLVDQTVEMFYSQGIMEVGVIQATHHMTDNEQPIQVASIQTLMKRTLPKADVVLIDEAHRWFTFYETWLSKDKSPDWAKIPFIGLSATPWTSGLGVWYDYFHKASTTQGMIEAGHLSPFKVYAPTHPDLSGVRTVAGDYHEGELSAKMSEGKLVADVVETWLRLGGDRPTLCYAVDRIHAKHLQKKFIEAGVGCGYQDAFTKDADVRNKESGELIDGRKTIKEKFHNGQYKVVCNVGTLTTGIDWDVRCISMCRPTKSDMLFVQIIGRGLRTAPGKDHCLILDHSDNHQRLGFVTDIDESYTGLSTGKGPAHDKRTDLIRLPKECPKCSYLRPPRMAKCPACGFVATAQCKIEHEAGELRELKPKPKVKPGEATPRTQDEKRAFFAELKGYAVQHGYKPGWAANQYRERIGTWPANDMQGVAPIYPRFNTLAWVRERMVAYAKSRQKLAKPGGSYDQP